MKQLLKESHSAIKDKKWIFALLFIAIIIGLSLRAYHFGYPVVGYHNWKETHYLTEARNFAEEGFFAHGFFVPALDYPQLDSDPTGAHADTFPFISIVVGVFFKIFGAKIAVARAVDLFFNILIIPAMFLFVRRLFKKDDIALVAAFITAITPLFVFFAHNTQLQNPGLLFMLLAGYFYIRWFENDVDLDLILTSAFVALSALNVFTFLVILIPIALTFPLERIKRFTLGRLKTYFISGALLSTVPLWILYMRYVVMPRTGLTTFSSGLINLTPLYNPNFWATIRAYAADNYTLFGVVIAFAGMLVIAAHLLKEKGLFGKQIAIPFILATIVFVALIALKAQFKMFYAILFGAIALFALPIFKHEEESTNSAFSYKFLLTYILGSGLFFLLLAEKLGGHSYHQYPIAPMFIIAASLAVVSVSTNVGTLISSKMKEAGSAEKIGRADVFKIMRYLVVFILVITLIYGPLAGKGAATKSLLGDDLALSGSLDAKNRQFNTQFPGIDIAGEYIKSNSAQTDRVLISGGEIMGILWHADRKGFYGISSLDVIKKAESKGANWVFIYMPLGRGELANQDIVSYLQANYRLKQLAFVRAENSLSGVYLLLKKGGTFNQSQVDTIVRENAPASKDYELTKGGKITIAYVNVPENAKIK